MKEISYAIFAQLVYNNYYKVEEKDYSKTLLDVNRDIWDAIKPNYFDEQVTGKQEKKEDTKIVNGEKKAVKLYSSKDSRIFNTLSIEEVLPEENPYFQEELEGWKLLLAKDHIQIYDDMVEENKCCI